MREYFLDRGWRISKRHLLEVLKRWYRASINDMIKEDIDFQRRINLDKYNKDFHHYAWRIGPGKYPYDFYLVKSEDQRGNNPHVRIAIVSSDKLKFEIAEKITMIKSKNGIKPEDTDIGDRVVIGVIDFRYSTKSLQ